MSRTVRFPTAALSARASGATLLSAALVALSAALAASPAVADQAYPPGLFENSPVVPHGQPNGEPAPTQPSGPDGPDADGGPPGPDADAAPPGYDAPMGAPGYGAPPGSPGYDAPPPGYGGPVVPRGYQAPPGPYVPLPGRPEAYAPPHDYCAGIATRIFRSVEELRRAHARCDRAYYAPPPPGYPPAY
jgi:hypothetical protein